MNIPLGNSNTNSSEGNEGIRIETRSASGGDPGSAAPKYSFKFAGRAKKILPGVLLFLFVVCVFLPSIRNDFTNYDDDTYITANSHTQSGLTWEGAKWAFRSTLCCNWHPLTILSHMLDCQLFGLQPWGHHLTSVLIHAVSTLLLFLVLKRMTGSLWRSLFVAAVFGVHPLRVESVTWISERKDVLGTLFWMLTMLTYVAYAEKSKVQSPKSKVFYWLTILSFALGLMSKPMLVTLPFVLLLLDYWPLERWRHKSVWSLAIEKAPFFLLAMIASAVTFMVQKKQVPC